MRGKREGSTNGPEYTAEEKKALIEIVPKYNLYGFWASYCEKIEKKEMNGYKVYSREESKAINGEFASFLLFLFIPLGYFDKSKVALSEKLKTEIETKRLAMFSGDGSCKIKSVEAIYENIIKKNQQVRALLPGEKYDKTQSPKGKSWRERLLKYLETDKYYRGMIEYIIQALDFLEISSNQIRDFLDYKEEENALNINKYYEIICQIKNIKTTDDNQNEAVLEYQRNMAEEQQKRIAEEFQCNPKEALAKYFICLLLGERVLKGLDFIFPLLKNIDGPDALHRETLKGYLATEDYRNIYKMLENIYVPEDMKLGVLNPKDVDCDKCLDYYALGTLYRQREIEIDTHTKLEENKDIVEKAYKSFIQLSEERGRDIDGIQSYIGEAIVWLYNRGEKKLIESCHIEGFGKTVEEILQKAKEFGNTDAIFLLGNIYEQEGKRDEAIKMYVESSDVVAKRRGVRILKDILSESPEKYSVYRKFIFSAAKNNSEEAIEILDHFERENKDENAEKYDCFHNDYYIIIGNNKENKYFVNSLPDSSKVFVFDDDSLGCINPNRIENWDEELGLDISFENSLDCLNKHIYFVALGSNQQLNLKMTIRFIQNCLDRWEDTYNTQISTFFTENVKIACNVNRKESEIYIDRLQSKKIGFYVPIRYISYFEEASYELLWDKAPLFSVDMNRKHWGKKTYSFVVLTDTMDTIPIINNMLSLMYFGSDQIRFAVKVVGPIAKKIESYMKIYEEGLFDDKYIKNDRLDKVEFCVTEFDDELVWDWEQKYSEEDVPAKNIIKDAEYVVCALSSVNDNIRIAELIREKEVRMLTGLKESNYASLRQIACLCYDNNLIKEATGFFVDNDFISYPWYTNFNLIGFGDMSTIYSFENVFESFLEKLAYKMNEAYDRDENGEVADVNDVKQKYYSSIYSIDSSKINAVYSLYHMYTVGLFDCLLRWNLGSIKRNYQIYLEKFEKVVNENLEMLAMRQHNQWVMFMKTRGYSRATISDVMGYISKGNSKHHSLKVIKLHPYMIPWEQMGDTAEEAFKKCQEALNISLYNVKNEYNGMIDKSEKDINLVNELKSNFYKDIIISSIIYKELGAGEIRTLLKLSEEEEENVKTCEQLGLHILQLEPIYQKKFNLDIPEKLFEKYGKVIEELLEYMINANATLDIEKMREMYAGWCQDVLIEKQFAWEKERIDELCSKICLIKARTSYFWDNYFMMFSDEIKAQLNEDISNVESIFKNNIENLFINKEKDINKEKEIKDILSKIEGHYNIIKENGASGIVLVELGNYDGCDEEEEGEKEKIINKLEKQYDISADLMKKIKADFSKVKNVLNKLNRGSYPQYMESYCKLVSILLRTYQSLIKILNETIDAKSGTTGTGFQYEIDTLMDSMDMKKLGSIKDNDRRMINFIAENYRILGKELGYVIEQTAIKDK